MPDYYYRMNPDGSFQNGTGVGSETASEHEMFRKYMIDSILYWVKEYNIDGFRFVAFMILKRCVKFGKR